MAKWSKWGKLIQHPTAWNVQNFTTLYPLSLLYVLAKCMHGRIALFLLNRQFKWKIVSHCVNDFPWKKIWTKDSFGSSIFCYALVFLRPRIKLCVLKLHILTKTKCKIIEKLIEKVPAYNISNGEQPQFPSIQALFNRWCTKVSQFPLLARQSIKVDQLWAFSRLTD